MLSLRDLQAAFGRALLAGDEGGIAAGLADAIAGDGLSPGARVAIYRHHVVDTLTGVLEAAYPVVTRLVHERFFAYAADQYIRACPPAGPCLFEYGASFPQFLEALPPCRPLPYLPDVARLEWALHRARHAEDAVPIDPAILRDLGIDAAVGATVPAAPRGVAPGLPVADRRHLASQSAGGRSRPSPSIWIGGVSSSRCGGTGTTRSSAPWTRRAMPVAGASAEGRTLEEAAAAALEVDSSFDLVGALRELFAAHIVVEFTGRDVDARTSR